MPAKLARTTAARPSRSVFHLAALPEELSALVVDQMPLRSMARLALTNAAWAECVQRSLRRFETWSNSYTNHRCCHDLTCEARALVAPDDSWSWQDHLHVLEAVAVRQHASELVWLIESLVGSPWWEPRYFDEEAVGRAASRCLVGRGVSNGLAPETVMQLYNVFQQQRNPEGGNMHCGGNAATGEAHSEECGGFCTDNEMATRAWSLRALTKPLAAADALGGSEAPTVRLCMSRSARAPTEAAFFLLNYIGAVWEVWDFTPADAHALAGLAVELDLDAATVAALLSRLADEEAASQSTDGAAPAADAAFPCTCTLLREWAAAAEFPSKWSTPDRALILASLALQARRQGFKAAATPVMLELVRDLVAAPSAAAEVEGGMEYVRRASEDAVCEPCEPCEPSGSCAVGCSCARRLRLS